MNPRSARAVGLAAAGDVALGGVVLVALMLLRDRPGSPGSPGGP